MKKFLAALLAACCLQVYAQEKVILEKPQVDKRVELLSIVFRLAGNSEYSSTEFKPYADRIEQHFGAYKNHELIQLIKSIAKERRPGYDAPMRIAIFVGDDLKPQPNVGNDTWQGNPRWTKELVDKFIPLLQQFAKDSKFDDFFDANADLYAEAVKRFAPIYEQIDLKWYGAFFGQELTSTFSMIIGVGNGRHNYGPAVSYTNGSKTAYAIMGMDSLNPFLVLVHEFNHSFVNHLIDKNKKALEESGKKLLSAAENKMRSQAYGDWESTVTESLVRATLIKYYKDHFEPLKVEEEVEREKNSGFLWIEELVAELENYDKQRGKYPTLESYMPKLIDTYTALAERITR